MVTLIVGKKGAGKTKKLVDAANKAATTISGNVVVIEPKEKLTLDIAHEARLISLEPYGVSSADQLFGFVSGICAGNYDVQEIYIDSLLKVIGEVALADFVEKVEKLAKMAEVKMTLSVSSTEDELPEAVKAIATIEE